MLPLLKCFTVNCRYHNNIICLLSKMFMSSIALHEHDHLDRPKWIPGFLPFIELILIALTASIDVPSNSVLSIVTGRCLET